ncbi:NTP transferase domain-containing protein [Eggerthella sinensis]|uniref:NTP transferase domain-containing protein n=1 Tax=Eggerthella sinensis TaxID=242230 RepID=UPI001D076483|nr:NTP transferase domain-containing protein [Eggerthella sinensis]MCB7038016.1 NTP transferase domain-containing protein [Eggerthella sinensis]
MFYCEYVPAIFSVRREERPAIERGVVRCVIMANGRGSRWGNYRSVPKHLSVVDGETLLERTVRLVKELNPEAEVVISSSDERYEIPQARRHSPERDAYELDRFCFELIEDETCFLYGDVFYTNEVMESILSTPCEGMLFWGSATSIYAVRVKRGAILRQCIEILRGKIVAREIDDAKGWQVYHLYNEMPLEGREIGGGFCIVSDETMDFNCPEDYDSFVLRHESKN